MGYKGNLPDQEKVLDVDELAILAPSLAPHDGEWLYQPVFKQLDGSCATFDANHTAGEQCDVEKYPSTFGLAGSSSVLHRGLSTHHAIRCPLQRVEAWCPYQASLWAHQCAACGPLGDNVATVGRRWRRRSL